MGPTCTPGSLAKWDRFLYFLAPNSTPKSRSPPPPSPPLHGRYHPVFKEILLASTNGVSPCVQDSDGVRISAGAPSEEVYEFHFRSRCACVGGCGGGGCGPACLPQGPLRPTHNHPPHQTGGPVSSQAAVLIGHHSRGRSTVQTTVSNFPPWALPPPRSASRCSSSGIWSSGWRTTRWPATPPPWRSCAAQCVICCGKASEGFFKPVENSV